ncbi:MAG: hypothetical protein EOP84_21790, partial [Verrucomicrobiaceae bacterium]
MRIASSSYPVSRRVLQAAALLLLHQLVCLTGWAQQQEQNQAWADFKNLIFTGPPAAPLRQAASVAIYSGNVGLAGNAATPQSAGTYLVRSVIGAPVEGRLFFDVKVGEVITAELTGADYSKAPIIDNSLHAFYVPDYTWVEQLPGGGTANRTGAVFATSPGYVEIQWRDSSNNPLPSLRRYLVSPISGWPTDPVAVYHTHTTEDISASPAPPPSTRAPVVNVPSSYTVSIHYSEAVPSGTWLRRTASGDFYARGQTGFVFLEYRGPGITNPPVRMELVEVRPPRPGGGLGAISSVFIGDRLKPNLAEPADPERRGKPSVTLGLGPAQPVEKLAYQHVMNGSPQSGSVYSVRRHSGAAEDESPGGIVEVYWKKKTVLPNVEWPYDLVWYKSDWPVGDPSRYQRYVRGTPAGAPPVLG